MKKGMSINEAISALNNKTNLNNKKRLKEAFPDSVNVSDCTQLASYEQAQEVCRRLAAYWDFGYAQRFFDMYTDRNRGFIGLFVYEDGEDSFAFALRNDGRIEGPYDIHDRPVNVNIDVDIPLNNNAPAREHAWYDDANDWYEACDIFFRAHQQDFNRADQAVRQNIFQPLGIRPIGNAFVDVDEDDDGRMYFVMGYELRRQDKLRLYNMNFREQDALIDTLPDIPAFGEGSKGFGFFLDRGTEVGGFENCVEFYAI